MWRRLTSRSSRITHATRTRGAVADEGAVTRRAFYRASGALVRAHLVMRLVSDRQSDESPPTARRPLRYSGSPSGPDSTRIAFALGSRSRGAGPVHVSFVFAILLIGCRRSIIFTFHTPSHVKRTGSRVSRGDTRQKMTAALRASGRARGLTGTSGGTLRG